MGWEPSQSDPQGPCHPRPGRRDWLTHEESHTGTAFPAFEMEAYRMVKSVDFPRTEAGDLAGTVHPQLQGCVCVCVGAWVGGGKGGGRHSWVTLLGVSENRGAEAGTTVPPKESPAPQN